MKFFYPLTFLIAIILSACKKTSEEPIPTSLDYKKAEALFDIKNDSAYYYFSKIVAHSKDSLQIARSYNMMARIQYYNGDYFGAQESSLTSLKYLDEKKLNDFYCLLSNYNELGRTSSTLKNYEAANAYYDMVIKRLENNIFKIITLNNKALVYQKKKDYPQAIKIYNSILEESKDSITEYARVLSNLATSKWLQDSSYNAAPELLKALAIRTEAKDNWGLNASYAHLSDYYSSSNTDSALIYAEKMYAIAQQNSSPDDQIEALVKLIKLSPTKDAKEYFNSYQFLNDSVQTSRNNAKNQFALIRYETEKHKSENLTLQKDNAEKKVRIIQQWGILLGIIVLGVLIFQWYRKQKERAMREQQLETSKKVHDKVANGIYRIMSEIEHRGIVNLERLLDKLERVYNLSRDISYDQPDTEDKDYHLSVSELLDSFNSDKTTISVWGNNSVTWADLAPGTRQEISLVLQELMTNMKKHSKAENVEISFIKEVKKLVINYNDDGIGLLPSFRYGNGLANTENRIAAINGQLIFEQVEKKGLHIKILIPIA